MNKKVAIPWGLFTLTAMFAIMRPPNIVYVKCNNSTVGRESPHSDQVERYHEPHYVEHAEPHYVEHAEPHYVEHAEPHYVEHAEPHYVEHAKPHYAEPHYMRQHHAPPHVEDPYDPPTDEPRSILFIMSVTLLTYAFMKVVVVPPRGYKKYI